MFVGMCIYIMPPYLWETHSKIPSGCLKPQDSAEDVYTMFFPMHTYL